jgi:conjugal transfer ATP-binding protein TraC
MKQMKSKVRKKPAPAKQKPVKQKSEPADVAESKQPVLKRLIFGEEKPDLTELESGSTTILDILSPTAVDTKSRDYIVVDGIFHAYLYVTGYGYTTTVGTSWLAPLVEAGEGINLNFTVRRQSKEKILSKISQTTMLNRSRMRDVGDTRQDYEELDSAISSGLYLKDVMNRQGEDFYYMHTLIEVTADDAETLEQRVTELEKLCVSVDMIARRCDYKQEQAFLSALPLLTLDADIERKSRRNALTSGVAAAFPFASYELSDRNGIFLGLNLYNRSPVFLDPYDDYKYTNGNFWLGGTSGAGKTFTLQCMGGRLRQQGKRVIFIIPKKGHEFRPLCELLGGLYLRLSPSSKDCPNLMAIRRTSLDAYSGLHGLTARDDSVLAEKISRLIIWYSLQKRDLTDEDKSLLDSSLVECYKRYGIDFDNASITDESGAFKEMPIFADWYEVLQQNPDTKHLAVVLSRYVTGSAAAMGARNDIDLNNKYIVLDTSGMPDDLILPGIFWATDLANDLIMSAGSDLSALIADELWSLVGASSNPLAAGFVLEMVKTIRGLGGIAITSTQGMQDLFGLEGGKYGKGILDSSRIKLIMQMEEQEARLIQGVLNLSEDEVRQITRFRRGEGLLCIGYNHVPIAFHATQKEYDAITTSPTDLRSRGEAMTDE